ncbi:hypothetical protein E1A91_A13G075800v1 [Gossypium mustelinum]|uniref:Uncharacterized protein n=1 Tax=Gossypium mustelinum TaxID=34275 RepID=A0A5D2WF24_GOSMU|nr:hypothetical protein E1A91_A13G075800v1 [Gossypium mustelinum]
MQFVDHSPRISLHLHFTQPKMYTQVKSLKAHATASAAKTEAASKFILTVAPTGAAHLAVGILPPGAYMFKPSNSFK